jgi:hypothetical protein
VPPSGGVRRPGEGLEPQPRASSEKPRASSDDSQQAFICKFSTNIQIRMKFGRFSRYLNQFLEFKLIIEQQWADSSYGLAAWAGTEQASRGQTGPHWALGRGHARWGARPGKASSRWRPWRWCSGTCSAKAADDSARVVDVRWLGRGSAERRWSSRTGSLGWRAQDGEGGTSGVGAHQSVALATNE